MLNGNVKGEFLSAESVLEVFVQRCYNVDWRIYVDRKIVTSAFVRKFALKRFELIDFESFSFVIN